MDKIKVNKKNVLKTLYENRKKHIDEYKDALRAYRVKCAELLDKKLKQVEEGEKFDMYFDVDEPTSHEKDYDMAIEMLEMDVDDTVTLTRQQFSYYIKDDWNWKDTFIYTNSGLSGYTGTTGYSGTGGNFKTIKFADDEV